jgi:hypothetical protein
MLLVTGYGVKLLDLILTVKLIRGQMIKLEFVGFFLWVGVRESQKQHLSIIILLMQELQELENLV